jgi:diadenosine tetraphosphate (Ap4A) HIT family hydrolase
MMPLPPDTEMIHKTSCLFCRIVAGDEPSYPVLANEDFLALLTPFPNTPGALVVLPRQHYASDIAALSQDFVNSAMDFSRQVDALARKVLGCSRCAYVVEGYGIDHFHIKLFPLHGAPDPWQAVHSQVVAFSERYDGHITTADGPRWDPACMEAMAARFHQYRQAEG